MTRPYLCKVLYHFKLHNHDRQGYPSNNVMEEDNHLPLQHMTRETVLVCWKEMITCNVNLTTWQLCHWCKGFHAKTVSVHGKTVSTALHFKLHVTR